MNKKQKESLTNLRRKYKCLTKKELIEQLEYAEDLGYFYIDYFPISYRIEFYNEDSDLLDFGRINRIGFKKLKRILDEVRYKKGVDFQVIIVDGNSDLLDIEGMW